MVNKPPYALPIAGIKPCTTRHYKDNMKRILKLYKEWPMSDQLRPGAYHVNNYIDSLKTYEDFYNAKWGIGKLVHYASPELKQRWERQLEKFRNAVINEDLKETALRYKGIEKGWEALEQHAVHAGHTPPLSPEYWSTEINDIEYRFVKSQAEATQLMNKSDEDIVVMTIEQAARIYAGRHKAAYTPEAVMTLGEVRPEFFKQDDEIGF